MGAGGRAWSVGVACFWAASLPLKTDPNIPGREKVVFSADEGASTLDCFSSCFSCSSFSLASGVILLIKLGSISGGGGGRERWIYHLILSY
jgi:hypothetical protein